MAHVKKWFAACMTALAGSILLMLVVFWIFDPYFHYHKPFPFVSYRMYDERYMNDGISRHFDYDAVITGTSMAQNFKPSEADALFGVTSVKETFSGASYKELSENLERALRRNGELGTVIWTMDANAILRDKDYMTYDDIRHIFTTIIHGMMCAMCLTKCVVPRRAEQSDHDAHRAAEYDARRVFLVGEGDRL